MDKITTAPTQNEIINKVNEIIDGKQDTLTAGTDLEIITPSPIPAPTGFKFLTYIDTKGNMQSLGQYIDTGVTADTPVETDIEFAFLTEPSDNAVLGARNSGTRLYGAYFYQGWCLGYGSNYTSSGGTVQVNHKYRVQSILKKDSQTVLVDGAEVINKQYSTDVSTSLPFYIGGMAYYLNGTLKAGYCTPIRFYRCSIKKNDVLVFNAYPVIRESDSAIGIYDFVSNQFLTNQGSGSFTAGEVITSSNTKIYFTNESNFIPYNTVVEDSNPFVKQNSLRFSKLDNTLYKSDRRFTVTLTGFNNNTVASRLFDGNWESKATLSTGSTGVINITSTSENLDMNYPYGWLYVSFYAGNAPLNIDSVSARVYQDWEGHNTGWVNLTTKEIVSEYQNRASIIRFQNLGVFNIYAIEITINNTNGDNELQPCQVEYFSNRTAIGTLPVVTKYGDNTIYGNVTADNFIGSISSLMVTNALGYTPYDSANPDGYTTNTGTVQSVNNIQPDANGDVSLTIPTVNDGVLTITQNGTSKGTFSANQSSNDTIALTDTTYNNFTGADGTNAGSSGLVPAPSATDNDKYLKGDGTWASVSGGSSTDVQINGTSITSGGVANIITNSAYNASSNKIATMSDLPSGGANTDLSNLTATGEAHFLKNRSSDADSIAIGSSNSASSAINIGDLSNCGDYSIAIGGYNNGHCSIMLGTGYINKDYSFDVGINDYNMYDGIGRVTYQMLDLKTGLIPDARISTNIARTSQIPSTSGLANTSLSNLSSTGKKVIDGQWVYSYSEIDTSTSVGNHTISLSSYLPNDSYEYEVLINVGVYSSSSDYTVVYMSSDILAIPYSDSYGKRIAHCNSNSRAACNRFIMPVGTGRYLIKTISNKAPTNYCTVGLLGYRRLGTNS